MNTESILNSFYNITLTVDDRKKLNGLNVRIERSDYRIYKFFAFKNYASKEEALRKAITFRNHHYNIAGYPKHLCRTHIIGADKSLNSKTGWSGIRIREKHDKRRNNTYGYISYAFRDLKTGEQKIKDIAISEINNTNRAIKHAVYEKNINTQHYNTIVDKYNELMYLHIQEACEQESIYTKPYLNNLRALQPKLWKRAYQSKHRSFTNGK